MSYQPENLKRWKLPDSYSGAEWPEYYCFLGQNRDSDSVSRSNFIRGLELIGGESDTVIVVREKHWAVGWVEWIAIHQSDDAALQAADELMAALSDYLVIDDDHLSQMEWNEAADYWERASIRERLEHCKDAEISIFAARHDCMPIGFFDHFRDSL